jgi:tetratricopeptide (TPR) repeat protein
MSTPLRSPDPSPENRPVSWPLIGAIVFLLISIVVTLILLGDLPLPAIDVGALFSTTGSSILTQEATINPAATEATATPLPLANAAPNYLILLNPPQGDASGLAERLPDAIRKALEGPPPGQQVQIEMSQTNASHGDLVVAWEASEGRLLKLTIHSSFEPAPAALDSVLVPYSVVASQATPLYVDAKSDGALPAGLIAAFVALSKQPDSATLNRIQALQAISSDLPPVQQAANQAVILFAIAETQAALGDPTSALATYSQALRLQADFPAAILNRGSVYLALGDTSAAQSAYEAVKDVASYQTVVQYNQAIASESAGDHDSALKAADQMATANPSAAWGVNLRGVIRYKRGEYEAALSDFMKAVTLDPNNPALLFNQARTLTALKLYAPALDIYRTLLMLEPNNPLYYFQQAVAYRDSGSLFEAEHAFSQAITLDDKYTDAYLERARLEALRKDYNSALADASQVLTFDPNNGPAYQISGDCWLAQEDWIKAEKAYTAAANNGVSNADLFAGRGWAHHRQRELDSAISDYQQAISLGDQDTTLLLRLGFALLDTNQKTKALDALMGAVNGGLNTAESHAALALALDMNTRTSEANQEYKRALELDPRFSDRKYLAGQPLWTTITIGRAMAIIRRLK